MKPQIDIIGDGRIGRALTLAFARKWSPVARIISRTTEREPVEGLLPRPIRNDDVFFGVAIISVRDSQIEVASNTVKSHLRPGCVVLHTSGSRSSEVLAPLREAGASIGSMHPLVSVSDPAAGAESLASGYFCIEGDEKACVAAKELVDVLGGRSFKIAPDKKALYHAAAVMSAGHIAALFSASVELLAECGVSTDEARKVLGPLVVSTAANLEHYSPEDALTGPFARGDRETIEKNLHAIRSSAHPDLAEIYCLLGLRSLDLARKKGISEEDIQAITAILRSK
ncbi:MAG TPA: DUF2520 domain-containing protein [Pyrinomonadaceae bacterium]|nr:DUF2520 domain-containing protein [Pyrinomonadaceae bacterium]